MTWTTTHYQWLTFLKDGLELYFAEREDVFVAGDLMWYPVEGSPEICAGPDVMVILGRPKGHRSSYRQWQEGDIAPAVVFEVFSEGNSSLEMTDKLAFFDLHGVTEYILLNPLNWQLTIYTRNERQALVAIAEPNGWQSPTLGMTFWADKSNKQFYVVLPDGQRMLSRAEEYQRAEKAKLTAEKERLAKERLAQKLRELGVDPDSV